MKLLLHACCGPCAAGATELLREEGILPTLYWNNPNIHPYTEYKARGDSLAQFAGEAGLELLREGEYGLREFLEGVFPAVDSRCAYCYRVRLEAAARYAAAQGYDAYSTTLLISPYQDHELLRSLGEELAAAHGVAFLYRDFRPSFREGQRRAREMGLYMQKYCGCIFSEEERYLGKKE